MSIEPTTGSRRRRLLRVWLPILLATALVVPLAIMWWSSLLPESMSAMEMGEADFGDGPALEHQHGQGHGGDGVSLTQLVADPARPADLRIELRAEAAKLTIADREIAGFTLNGTSPGPEIRASEGQLVEVRLTNVSVAGGVTLHWHGLDVPNAMDGVAGVTQDAVAPGEEFTYRFVADQVGTYWYHSHQVSHQQVAGGLFGPLVVEPATPGSEPIRDVVALAHTYAGIRTINGSPHDLVVAAAPGERVRVRVVNTDNAALPVWTAEPVVVAAVDGAEVNQPTPVRDERVGVAAGGRIDLLVTVPASGAARVQLSIATAILVGPPGAVPPAPVQPGRWFDLLAYGAPAEVGFDPARTDRNFSYIVTQRPGFVKGRPGVWWAINDRLYPDIPMFVVAEGELVGMHIENRTSDAHPMHLHGHHVLVVARNGVAASGSPWWTDSFDVLPAETFDIVFRADNPGIWMDHCHNLEHARDGMVAHLAYTGIATPFRVGGDAHNEPE